MAGGTARLHEHAAGDDLIAWGWQPGAGRDPAPGTQQLFGALVQAWIDTGRNVLGRNWVNSRSAAHQAECRSQGFDRGQSAYSSPAYDPQAVTVVQLNKVLVRLVIFERSHVTQHDRSEAVILRRLAWCEASGCGSWASRDRVNRVERPPDPPNRTRSSLVATGRDGP